MNDAQLIISLCSLVIAFVLFIFSCYNFAKSRKKDIGDDAKEILKSNMKLEQLCNTSNETRLDVKNISKSIETMTREQIIQGESIKSMWKRVDEHQKRLEKLEEKIL